MMDKILSIEENDKYTTETESAEDYIVKEEIFLEEDDDNLKFYIEDDIWKGIEKQITSILKIFHNVPLDVLSEYLVSCGYNNKEVQKMYLYMYNLGIIQYDTTRNYIHPTMVENISSEEKFASRAAFCIYARTGDMDKKMIAQASFPFNYEYLDSSNQACFLKVLSEGKVEAAIEFIRCYKHLKNINKIVFVRPPNLQCNDVLRTLEHPWVLYTFNGNNKISQILNNI